MPPVPWAPVGSMRYIFLDARRAECLEAYLGKRNHNWMKGLYNSWFEAFHWSINYMQDPTGDEILTEPTTTEGIAIKEAAKKAQRTVSLSSYQCHEENSPNHGCISATQELVQLPRLITIPRKQKARFYQDYHHYQHSHVQIRC